MTITKFGQSCLLVETDSARILLDPGSYSTAQNDLKNIDALLITHVHKDHLNLESVKAIVANNPNVKIFSNVQVKEALTNIGIECQLLGDGETTNVNGVSIEGFGTDHIEIHSSLPRDKNTGYLIAERFFHPGDSYTMPTKPVEILAWPVAGPWCKLGESVDYALAIKPKVAIPIHDAMLSDPNAAAKWPAGMVESEGISVKILELNEPVTL